MKNSKSNSIGTIIAIVLLIIILMKNSKSNSIGTIIAIVLLIIIIILSNVKASRSYLLTGAISKVFMPVQNMISYIKEKTMSEKCLKI